MTCKIYLPRFPTFLLDHRSPLLHNGAKEFMKSLGVQRHFLGPTFFIRTELTLMHYWQEVLKVMEITGRNPSSRIKDSQIRGRSPSIWEFFFLLRGLRPVIPNYLQNLLPIVTFLWQSLQTYFYLKPNSQVKGSQFIKLAVMVQN